MCAVHIVQFINGVDKKLSDATIVADTIRFEVVSFIMLVLLCCARFNGAYVDLINCAYTDRKPLNFSVEWVLECTYTCIHWQIQGSCTYTVGDLEMCMSLPLSLSRVPSYAISTEPTTTNAYNNDSTRSELWHSSAIFHAVPTSRTSSDFDTSSSVCLHIDIFTALSQSIDYWWASTMPSLGSKYNANAFKLSPAADYM